MPGHTDTQADIRKELRRAIFDCRERGLYEATAWAAQQLAGLPEETAPLEPGEVCPGGEDESDCYLLAKSFFDLKVCHTMILSILKQPRTAILSVLRACSGQQMVYQLRHGHCPGVPAM